eukprot:9503997-Pyramimonas_sp.AAC.3
MYGRHITTSGEAQSLQPKRLREGGGEEPGGEEADSVRMSVWLFPAATGSTEPATSIACPLHSGLRHGDHGPSEYEHV